MIECLQISLNNSNGKHVFLPIKHTKVFASEVKILSIQSTDLLIVLNNIS